ncbi:MAG: hypothetical protein HYS81_01170 [Candidatus Aenigmatarchaeota archaeon]|nr:MAG: hypothetical protein HYS81_01170 [Candidatus Aenigmarchaeota archaeon]
MNIKSSEVLGLLVLVLAIGIASGYSMAQPQFAQLAPFQADGAGTISEAHTSLVAVDKAGHGVVTGLDVKTVPGSGRILVDIDSLIFFVDTQQSIQTAREVAEDYLNTNVTDRDIVYTIKIENSSIVGGESAGGALTVATIAALTGKPLRGDTVMTGTVNQDGTIGKIGGLEEKARAAKEAGYSVLLVPAGQGAQTTVEKMRTCERVGRSTVCTVAFKQNNVSIGEDIGITVVEVANIQDVVDHFLSEGI